MVKVKLLRPLDGQAIGEEAEYPEADAKRLEERGAVRIIQEKAVAAAPRDKARKAAPANKGAKK